MKLRVWLLALAAVVVAAVIFLFVSSRSDARSGAQTSEPGNGAEVDQAARPSNVSVAPRARPGASRRAF